MSDLPSAHDASTYGELPAGHVQIIAKEASIADDLLEKADARGLRNLLVVAHKRESEIVRTMNTLCGLFSDKAVERRPDDPTSIEALRDVALSALDLAKRAFSEPTK